MSHPSDQIYLRDIEQSDLPIFFEHQLDQKAVHMAAFTAPDPSDRAAFDHYWQKVVAIEQNFFQTIVFEGQVVGHVLKHEAFGVPEVGYWIGRPFWGKGITTVALTLFLALVTVRPIFGRIAADNIASQRVLQKCGFTISHTERGYANARGMEIDEVVLKLVRQQDSIL
ncbi:MAG: GNAT family N-acetyltransferase [Candidatus Promineifilaceae bacterium]